MSMADPVVSVDLSIRDRDDEAPGRPLQLPPPEGGDSGLRVHPVGGSLLEAAPGDDDGSSSSRFPARRRRR